MFKFVPYKREHVIPFLDQPSNIGIKDIFLKDNATQFENYNSVTGTFNDVPVFCGGILKVWEKRGFIWTVFNEDCKKNFVPVFRGIKKYLTEQQEIYHRIEVAIPVDFEIGRRRAEMLGFKIECPLARKFFSDGQDCALYAMVRD